MIRGKNNCLCTIWIDALATLTATHLIQGEVRQGLLPITNHLTPKDNIVRTGVHKSLYLVLQTC